MIDQTRMVVKLLAVLCLCAYAMPGAAIAQPPQKSAPPKVEKISEPKIQVKDYAQSFDYSFKGASKIGKEFEYSGPEGDRYVKFDPAGLQIKLPKGESTIGSHHGVIANLPITGDFEVTVGFELANEPAPQGEKLGTGIAIAVKLDTPATNRAFLSRVTRWDKRLFGAYVEFWPPGADKAVKPFNMFPAQAAAGRLRIVRDGNQISYFVAEGADKNFNFLRTDPFRPDDVRQIHITGTVGGPESWLDAHVTSLHVRADTIAGAVAAQQPAAAPPGAAPPGAAPVRQGSRGWLLAGLLFLFTIGAILTVGFVFLRKRGEAAKPLPTDAAPASVSFTCPTCAKDLKSKVAMAGKKVKCPKCEAVVLVPSIEADKARGVV